MPLVYYSVSVQNRFTREESEVSFRHFIPAAGYAKAMEHSGRNVTLKVVCDDGLERKVELHNPSINHPCISPSP